MSKETTLWLGDEASYYAGIEAFKKYEEAIAAKVVGKAGKPQIGGGASAMSSDEDEDEKSPYLSVVDGVGIVTVSGAMYDGRFGMIGSWFGIIGYGDIQDALVQAVRDQAVSSVLLVLKSAGGQVTGVSETAELIRNVDKIKAVTTFSPSTMCSAALWLGVSARKVYASDMAEVGSIGTLLVLMSRHEQLKKDGIDARVLRSGKYKALGHPAEPLTDATVEHYQERVNLLGAKFLEYVADRRGVSVAAADTRFGQGRTFIGSQALDVGLVDGIKTYSAAFGEVRNLALADNKPKLIASAVDTPTVQADNANPSEGNPAMTKKDSHVPTPEQLAAIAAGVTLDVQASADEAAAAKAAADKAAADAAAAAAAGGEDGDADDSSVAGLQAKLSTAEASIADLTTKVTAFQAQIAAFEAEKATMQASIDALTKQAAPVEALVGIVSASIKTMSVAMNLPGADLKGVAPEDVVAKHAELVTQFKAKYPVGGVAATGGKDTEEPAPKVNPLFAQANLLNMQRK